MKVSNWIVVFSVVVLLFVGSAAAQMTCNECEETCSGECAELYCESELVITDGEVQPVYAGRTNYAGNMEVYIQDGFLVLDYIPAGCWDLNSEKTEQFKVQLYTDPLPGSRPSAGGFPYKVTDSYKIEIPLSAVYTKLGEECPTEPKSIYIAAHFDLMCYDTDPPSEDTGWAGNNAGSGSAWWFYSITVFGCDELCYCECKEECWCGETAWAAGSRYVSRGNWATYTEYADGKVPTLFAGQKLVAGTVSFYETDDGKVEITIDLNDGWRFKDVSENVKIQGYNTPPSGNPEPGLFNTFKGTASIDSNSFTTEELDKYAYYGVHVDVEHVCTCPE